MLVLDLQRTCCEIGHPKKSTHGRVAEADDRSARRERQIDQLKRNDEQSCEHSKLEYRYRNSSRRSNWGGETDKNRDGRQGWLRGFAQSILIDRPLC